MFLKVLVLASKFLEILFNLTPLSENLKSKSRFRSLTWFKSLAAIHNMDRLVDLDLPWWPFSATEEVEKLFWERNISIFEWGSGASTIWLSRRGNSVVSVEHNENWGVKVQQKLVQLGFDSKIQIEEPSISSDPMFYSEKKGYLGMDFSNYVNAIHKYGKFDLIVIDGRARKFCFQECLSHLNPRGVILFDNSSRIRYKNILEKFAKSRHDMRIFFYKGITPASPLPTECALIFFE